MVIAALVGVGGYFRLATVSFGRMALGVAVWIVWGAAAYFGSALMTRLSQHWLNLLPPEIDLTEVDEEAGNQNAVSAGVGRRYVEFVLRSQHAFAVDAGTLLVEQYYESNLLTRIASRDEDLDAFIREDILQARKDLQAVAHEFQRKDINEPPAGSAQRARAQGLAVASPANAT